jgi:tetratricopeptide (TPR) repeat protein
MDMALVGVVVLLTFLLGSFTARNSDLWLHLATGRAIAQHGSPLRQDPFTFTAEGTWANNSWFSDLVLYNVFRLAGGTDLSNPDLSLAGPVLIGAKALVMVFLAWIMMRIRRPGQSLLPAALCTAMAVVVLSRWTFLQPRCISFLFLGLTLYLLQRSEPGPEDKKFSLSRNIVAIPILFAIWVNLDEWFILGPITVGLFLVGDLIQQFLFPIRTGEDAPLPGQIGRRGLVLVVGLATCLLNPYFLAAFKIPSDLWPMVTNSPILSDERLAIHFRQPFTSEAFNSSFSSNPSSAEMAYYVLAGLGLASFFLNWADWRGWRTTVWLGFFLLSAYLERCIPFFAVVAGPITALNFQDFIARRYGTEMKIENPWKTISIVGRLLTLTAGVLLVVAAWPGMLHSYYDDPIRTHHVSWRLDADPSLVQAAGKLRELHQAGVIGDGNGLNLAPEIGDYLAWFCPEEKTFFDRRYSLFSRVAGAYVDARAALGPMKVQSQMDIVAEDRKQKKNLLGLMSENRINHLIISSAFMFDQIRDAVVRLMIDPTQWTLLYIDGRTAIFAANQSGTANDKNRFASFGYRPAPLAFGPDVPSSDRAPLTAPHFEDIPTEWERLWRGPAAPSVNTDTCSMFMTYSQILRGHSNSYAMAKLASLDLLALVGPASAAYCGHFEAQAAVPLRLLRTREKESELLIDPRLEPAATALLAIRGGRRAVKENPSDHRAYLELARAIAFLANSEEGSGGALRQMRQIQQVAALHRAEILKPDSIEVQEALATAYLQMDLRPFPSPLDLVIDHLDKIVSIRDKEGPKGKQTEEEFRKELEQRKLKIKSLRDQMGLDRRQTDYESEKRRQKSRFRQASEAMKRGLYQEALKVLLDPDDTSDRGPEGDKLTIQLLIWTGQLDEARAFISGSTDQLIDTQNIGPSEMQTEFDIAAGSGDYARADEALNQLIKQREEAITKQLMHSLEISTWTRDFGQTGAPRGMGPELIRELIVANSFLTQLADSWAVRGVLALEVGDTAKAQEYFGRAIHLVKPPAVFSQQFVALRYQDLLNYAKERAAKKTP